MKLSITVLLQVLFLRPMKKTVFYFTAALLFVACNSNSSNEHKPKHFPKPGTTVAADQMPIVEDALNHSVFSVKVIADSDITSGVYDVDADFGPNFGEGKFSMPKGIEDLQPIIRKGSNKYTFIIGFRLPDDTAFKDYFQVSCTKSSTKMEYIKAYSF